MENEQGPSRPVEEKASETAPAQDQPDMKPVVLEEKAAPSGFNKFLKGLRMGLIGLVVAIVLFFAGFLTDHFVRFQPMRAEFDSTKLQLTDVEKQATGLTDQLTAANSQLTSDESRPGRRQRTHRIIAGSERGPGRLYRPGRFRSLRGKGRPCEYSQAVGEP